MSSEITCICDQCGEQIYRVASGSIAVSRPWTVQFAEERDGKWSAELCSKKCLGLLVDSWREKPTLRVVE